MMKGVLKMLVGFVFGNVWQVVVLMVVVSDVWVVVVLGWLLCVMYDIEYCYVVCVEFVQYQVCL